MASLAATTTTPLTWEACRTWAGITADAARHRHFLLKTLDNSLHACCSKRLDGCSSALACRSGHECTLSVSAAPQIHSWEQCANAQVRGASR